MRKLILALVLITFLGCKNNVKNEEKNTSVENMEKTEKQSDGLTLLKGEFIYYTSPKDTIGAAVLQTHNEIYAVIINDKMYELNEQVQEYKNEVTDMIPVEIRGKITPKPEDEEGWNYRVEIKEILNVSKPKPENNEIITIGKEE